MTHHELLDKIGTVEGFNEIDRRLKLLDEVRCSIDNAKDFTTDELLFDIVTKVKKLEG